jgi:hypothetical protein
MSTSLPLSLSRILRIACWLIGLVAAILMAPPVVAQQSAFLTNGLVAYYSFNDSSRDFSGNKNDAKLMEGSSYDFGRFGADRCVYINGKPGLNSGISYDNKFINVGQNEYSLTIWFKSNDSRNTSQSIIHGFPHYSLSIGYNRDFGKNYTFILVTEQFGKCAKCYLMIVFRKMSGTFCLL